MARNQNCVVPGCVGAQDSRGLCMSCYGSACRLVKMGRTTWAELIEMGLATRTQLEGATTTFTKVYKRLKRTKRLK